MTPQNNNEQILLWSAFVSNGIKKALGKIYVFYYDELFNYGTRYIKDQQIIEGSIQNLFSYFLQIRESLPPVSNLSGYLFKGFRRQLFNDIEKHKKLIYPGIFPENNFEYFKSPEDEFILIEEQVQSNLILRKCISNLTPKQQEIIYLRFNCELTYTAISHILEIEIESCHKIVYRSIKSLKSELDKMKLSDKYI